jgi:hypothetical protein
MCYSYSRLRSEFDKLSKEKRGGGLWRMFSSKLAKNGGSPSRLFGGKPHGYKEVQMTDMIADDDELDQEDMEGNFH